GPASGWSSPAVIPGFALSPVSLAAFWWAERVAPEPLLPLGWLRRRNFALPIGAQMFGNFAYMGGFILAPSLLHRVFGYGESTIGFLVLSRPLAFSLMAPAAGYLAVRMGERIAAVLGASAVVASMLVFAAIDRQSSMVLVIAAL